MLIYSAGPIDSAATADPDLRRLVAHLRGSVLAPLAKEQGWVVFHPERAYSIPAGTIEQHGAAIDTVNRGVILDCDVVVAILVAGVPTWGTPAEVEYALGIRKPVVVMADLTASGSVQLSAWRQAGARVLYLGMSDSSQHLAQQREDLRAQVLAAVVNGPALRPSAGPVDPHAMVIRWDGTGTMNVDLGEPEFERLEEQYDDGGFVHTIGRPLLTSVLDGQPPAQAGHLLFSHANVQADERTTTFDLRRAYPDDAGFDLTAVGDHLVVVGGRAQIPLSVSVAPPPDHWGFLVARSSLWTKLGLMMIPGVIDTGWRGPLYAQVYNPGPDPTLVKHNSRVAQLILLPTWQGEANFVTRLPEHKRGINGFGSSGGHGDEEVK